MAICDNYLTDIYDAHFNADWQLDTFLDPLKQWFKDARFTHDNFNDDWRTHISSMVTTVTEILRYLIHGNWQGYHPFRLHYYLANCISAEVDMSTLLSTMLSADFEELRYFVGIVDAYRQAIWNKPFNAEFFAAIARGFEG